MKQVLQALVRRVLVALRTAPAAQRAPLVSLNAAELRAVAGGVDTGDLPRGNW